MFVSGTVIWIVCGLFSVLYGKAKSGMHMAEQVYCMVAWSPVWGIIVCNDLMVYSLQRRSCYQKKHPEFPSIWYILRLYSYGSSTEMFLEQYNNQLIVLGMPLPLPFQEACSFLCTRLFVHCKVTVTSTNRSKDVESGVTWMHIYTLFSEVQTSARKEAEIYKGMYLVLVVRDAGISPVAACVAATLNRCSHQQIHLSYYVLCQKNPVY